MRFAAASAFFFGAAMAGSTVYSTEYFTITSCAPEVTDCPARSTVVSSTSYAVVATTTPAVQVFPSGNSTAPAPYPTTLSSAKPVESVSVPVAQAVESSSGPSTSVFAITTTTCMPTVIYKTITYTPTTAAPSAGTVIPGYSNSTAVATPKTTVPVTAGASVQGGSLVLAAAAGFAAIILA